MLRMTKKHFACIYEYPLVIFFVCSLGMAGAAARCILRAIGPRLLEKPLSTELKALIREWEESPHDKFLWPLISVDVDEFIRVDIAVWLGTKGRS